MSDTILDTGNTEGHGNDADQYTYSHDAGASGGFVNADGSFAEGWLDRLPESLADSKPTLEKFRTFEDFAKSYTSLQSLMGARANAVSVPNPKSSPEEVAAFRKAIGVPDSPDGYQLKPEQLPEGLSWDDEQAKGFAEIAHRHNVPPAAMKELAARYMAGESAKLEEYGKMAHAELAAARTDLLKEFGADYDRKIQTATRMAQAVGLDPGSPGLRDPEVVRALVRFSGMISEDRLGGSGAFAQTRGMSARDVIMNPSNPYHDRYQRGDAEVVEMVRDMMRQG